METSFLIGSVFMLLAAVFDDNLYAAGAWALIILMVPAVF